MQKILFSLFFLLTGILTAQDFDLNNYKYRFQKLRYAQFNFDFQGNNNYEVYKHTYKDSFPNSPRQRLTQDVNNLRINTTLPFYYFRTINTERLQHSQSANINIYYSSDSRIRDKTYNFSTQAGYGTSNRFYKGLNFTEFNFNISGNLNNGMNYEEYSNNYYKDISGEKGGNYSTNVGKGKGRLEYVTDAVTAMFILRDLKKKAGTGDYSSEQIENIAKGITKINNTRFIDFRFRLIDQLTLLDSLFKTNGIVPTSEIRYFTTINDNWLYAKKFQRYSGKRWSVNYLNEGSTNRRNNNFKRADTSEYIKRRYTNTNMYNGIELHYTRSKQTSLFIQKIFGIRVGGGINIHTSMAKVIDPGQGNLETKTKPDNTQYYISLNWGYLFQPNTRTFILFDMDLNSRLTKNIYGLRVGNTENRINSIFYHSINPRLSVFKFFTPRFSYNLEVSSQVTMRSDKFSNNSYMGRSDNYNFPVSVNMGFTYTFF